MILEGCGCWSGGVELQLLVSTWRVQNVNTSRHWDDLILSRSHGERVDKWPESTVRSFSSTSLWSSTPIHSHALSLYSALHIMLLIYLFSYYTYTGMIIRYSTTIVLLICFRNVEHACIQKHYSFAKMIAVWTPQGMAYLRGAGRPQDPVLAAEWLGGVQFVFIEKMIRMRNMFQYVLMFSTWILTFLIQKFMHHLMFAVFVCLCVEPMVDKYRSHSRFSKG